MPSRIRTAICSSLMCSLAVIAMSATTAGETSSEQEARIAQEVAQEEARFYAAYPELINEKETVKAAYRSLKAEGYNGKDYREACAALADRAHEFLARRSPEEWQKRAVALYPELGVAGSQLNSLFLARRHELQADDPHYFFFPNWPVKLAQECNSILQTRRGMPAPTSPTSTLATTEANTFSSSSEPSASPTPALEFSDDVQGTRSQSQVLPHNSPENFGTVILIVVISVGGVLLFLAGRASRPVSVSLSSKSEDMADEVPITAIQSEHHHPPFLSATPSIWRRAMHPAGVAAKWASFIGMMSVFRAHDFSFLERIGFALLFSVTLAIFVAGPVYLMAVLYYAIQHSQNTPPHT